MAYIKTESDVLKFVNALIINTKGQGKEGDEFWTSATCSQAVESLRTVRFYEKSVCELVI